MESVSTRLNTETYRLIAETADERGVSKAEILRELVKKGAEYDDLENERDRLQRQLAAVNSRQEEVTELVEYVEEERSWRSAGLTTRMKWWVFGK
jgi:predicted  nucleic acid-binding Zn-ribbon protein